MTDKRYYCPECGCTARVLPWTEGTDYLLCDDPECAWATLWGGEDD